VTGRMMSYLAYYAVWVNTEIFSEFYKGGVWKVEGGLIIHRVI